MGFSDEYLDFLSLNHGFKNHFSNTLRPQVSTECTSGTLDQKVNYSLCEDCLTIFGSGKNL